MLQVWWNQKVDLKCRTLIIAFVLLVTVSECRKKDIRISNYGKHRTTALPGPYGRRICTKLDDTIRAKHKSCFLRPDTGPCRADIIQWYFDVKEKKCYRFFWGGCQGNGNRFETHKDCMGYCFLNTSTAAGKVPNYCSLAFDYGNCFAHYNRWYWDTFAKTCKRRIYSGCGGNQNNFETRHECLSTCLRPPNNTLSSYKQFTTCIPLQMVEIQ